MDILPGFGQIRTREASQLVSQWFIVSLLPFICKSQADRTCRHVYTIRVVYSFQIGPAIG